MVWPNCLWLPTNCARCVITLSPEEREREDNLFHQALRRLVFNGRHRAITQTLLVGHPLDFQVRGPLPLPLPAGFLGRFRSSKSERRAQRLMWDTIVAYRGSLFDVLMCRSIFERHRIKKAVHRTYRAGKRLSGARTVPVRDYVVGLWTFDTETTPMLFPVVGSPSVAARQRKYYRRVAEARMRREENQKVGGNGSAEAVGTASPLLDADTVKAVRRVVDSQFQKYQ